MCSEQLAHSRTAKTIWSYDIHLFDINNNPNNNTDPYSPPAPPRHCGGMSKKAPPPTELQIPATVTTLSVATHLLM